MLLSNLLTVPAATGNADFSVWRSNTQCGVKKLTDTAENTIKCFFPDSHGDLAWGQSGVEAEEVCGEAGDVRSSHGSSAQDFGLPVFPGGSDVHAGSPDINGGTIIGEVGLRVIDIRSGDGDRLLSAGRRLAARILIIVSSGDDDGDATVVKLKMESHVSDVAATFYPPSARTPLTALSTLIEGS